MIADLLFIFVYWSLLVSYTSLLTTKTGECDSGKGETPVGRVYWQIEQARSPPQIPGLFCGSLLWASFVGLFCD